MKVKHLIEMLSKIDPEMEVRHGDDLGSGYLLSRAAIVEDGDPITGKDRKSLVLLDPRTQDCLEMSFGLDCVDSIEWVDPPVPTSDDDW